MALFLYSNICTGGAFVWQRDENRLGLGMNFKPRESRVICSSVSRSFDRFQMCFLSVENRFIFCFALIFKDSDNKQG